MEGMERPDRTEKLAHILADPEKIRKQRIVSTFEMHIAQAAKEALEDGMPSGKAAELLAGAAVLLTVGGVKRLRSVVSNCLETLAALPKTHVN